MAAPLWRIDPIHSSVEFEVQHLGMSTYQARFRELKGELVYDPAEPEKASVSVSIGVKSIDAVGERLVSRLFDADFFDAERFPEMIFRSTAVERAGERLKVTGELTLRDVTRPVTLDVQPLGEAVSPFGGHRVVAFRAETEIDRGDFGLKWNAVMDTGGQYLGEKVRIRLGVEASRR